ncbi:MAG: amidohydrolase [Bacteroidetes bacterium]|nr:MAG: amidohydrolase [Bacteroidota bacterium]
MIIDCHTHLNNYHNEEQESLATSLENLQREMRKNRVTISLVLTSYKITPGRPSTRSVVEATRHLNSIYVVAGINYYTFHKDELIELREYIREGKVRGLKIYPGYQEFYPNDAKLEPLFELAQEMEIPLMVHTGDTFTPKGKIKYSHPLHCDDLAVDHPKLKIVICHLGNPWFRDCMEVVYKNANVYTDFSGLVLGNFTDRFEQYMAKQLHEMIVWGLEPDKCLYGSDWPISSMESYLDFMDEIKIPVKDKRKIMFENSVRLFKIPIDQFQLRGDSFFERLRVNGKKMVE